MSDGIGCVCAARSEYECCCDADWRPQELIDLQQQLASREAEVIRLIEQNAKRLIGLCKCGIERDQLRAQINVLREALTKERDLRVFGQSEKCGKTHWESIMDMRRDVYKRTEEALAATEPKP